MRIRSLTLHGFKSFGNRTVLEFSPRISVIAGPNGSGKSNVLDALRWATGGGRASDFRAGERTELIFHGASGKRSLGYAEVEVEVETPDGRVSVQRTLARDGVSRLRLNGRTARLLDVDEALAGSGLGKGSLAVIGQGEVAGVLLADPARLLHSVAEAAGVARLSGRREQAEARLGRAREHMERLAERHAEMLRRIARLEADSSAATTHATLTAELLRLRFTIAVLRRDSLGSSLREATEAEQELEATTGGLIADLAAATAQAREFSRAVDDLQERYRQATARFEAWRGELRLQESRSAAARERLTENTRRLGALDQELERLGSLTPPPEPEGNPANLEADISALERKTADGEAGEARLREEAAASSGQLERLRRKEQEHERAAGLLAERRQALERQLAATAERLAGVQAATPAGDEPEHGDPATLSARLAGAERTQEKLLGELAEAQQEHADATADLRSLEETLRRQQALVDARSGFAHGPRLALTSGLPGVIGAVADLLDVDSRYRQAVAAALGARAENIVARTAEDAQALIRFIRDKNAFITVLPLDLIRPRRPYDTERFRGDRGVVGPILEQLRFEPHLGALFTQLLGGTMIMEDLDSAVALARARGERPRLVTLAGELLEPGGAMSGGRRSAGASLIGQARELEKLGRERTEAERRTTATRERLLGLQEQARNARAHTSGLQDQLEAARKEAARRSEQQAIAAHLQKELSSQEQELRDALTALDSQEPPPAVPEEALRAAEAAQAAAAAALQAHATELQELKTRLQETRAELRLLRLKHEGFAEALARFNRERQRLSDLTAERTRQSEAATHLESALADELAATEALREAAPEQPETAGEALEAARNSLQTAQQQTEQLRADLAAHQEQLERARLTAARRETLLQAASEELERFPSGLEQLEGSERTLRNRLAEAEQTLEQLGAVNHRAATELDEETAAARALAADLLEAGSAAAELKETLEKMDAEVRERSEAAIAAVARSFGEHVTELFGAGAEAAIDTEYDEGRPAGLTIRLKPPGKHTTQLNLLSVGERTMGALAFLFALADASQAGGLPLAVLDEVDAPLDEANISRFTRFVEKLADRGTQFVLVSHQKTTFTIADTMWGVTAEAGVSSVFSISRDDQPAGLTSERGN